MNSQVTFRPILDDDLEFLYRVFATTRTDIAQLDWDDDEKERFIRIQFQAQHAHYQEHFSAAKFDVILVDGQPAGRIYVDRNDEEFRLIDIALLPDHRNHGIGSKIIQDLLDGAAAADKPVRLRVEPYNASLRLFQRLGFERIADEGINWHMQWRTGNATKPFTTSADRPAT